MNAPGLWNDRLQLMLESTGDGIFGVDNAGLRTFVNRAACEMLGWRAEQVLGSNMHGLIHHSHGDGSHYPESDCPIFNAVLVLVLVLVLVPDSPSSSTAAAACETRSSSPSARSKAGEVPMIP